MRQNYGLVCFGVVSALWATGMAGAQTTSEDKGDVKTHRTLLVVHGGFNSCGRGNNAPAGPRGMGMYWQIERTRASFRAKYGVSLPYIATCFGTSNRIRITQSDYPDNYWHGGYQDVAIELDYMIEKYGRLKPVIVGHSHGGWLAMQTALYLVAKGEVTRPTLYTIDPISRRHCRLPWTKSAPPPEDQKFLPGCKRAPTDLDSRFRRALDYHYAWYNYYQTQTWFLHSGPVAEADENHHFGYDNWLTAHQDMDADNRIWRWVRWSVKR